MCIGNENWETSSGDGCQVETPVEAIKKEADVLQSMAGTPQGAAAKPHGMTWGEKNHP